MIKFQFFLLISIASAFNFKHQCLFQNQPIQSESKTKTNNLQQSNTFFKTLQSYHPHYLHSYSYPKPSTIHISYARFEGNNAIMKIKSGYQDFQSNIFVINGQQKRINKQKIKKIRNYDSDILRTVLLFSIQDSYDQKYKQKSYLTMNEEKQNYIIKLNNGSKQSSFNLYITLNDIKLSIKQYEKENIKVYFRFQQGDPKTNYKYSNNLNFRAIDTKVVRTNNTLLAVEFQFPAKLFMKLFIHLQQIHKKSKPFHTIIQNNHNQTCSNASFSSLLKGLTYQYGTLILVHDNNNIQNQPKQLLSFSPSRTRFPWGFLWDDGFHNEVIVRKKKYLTLKIIKSWLDTMINGWIPREQNRGKQRQDLCSCPRFMAKDDRDGNPPSLILPLYYLLKKSDLSLQDIQIKYWKKLKQWHSWYFKTQMIAPDTYLFKWFDHLKSDIPYIEISFNSGMDDFPRPLGSAYFIDTQAWMYYFTKFMYQASVKFKDEDCQKYFDYMDKIKKNLILFKEKKTNLYKDVGKNIFGLTYHSEHLGYPSVLPLAFGMIQYKSAEYNATIYAITDRKKLNTGHGLSSIQKESHYYLQSRDSYWRGPVWININYLVLRGLKLYYPQQQAYIQLRKNLIQTVCGNWQKSGFFYENYSEGRGTFSYPFNGWTSLISLIVDQDY